MHHRVAIAVFVLIGLLAACGDDDPPPQPADARRTGRFTMTIDVNRPGHNAMLRASGAFDDERRRYSLNTDISGFVPGLDGPMAMVAMPDAVFIDSPSLTRLLEAPTKWIKVTGASGELIRTAFVDGLRLVGAISSDGLVPRTTMRFAGGANGGVALVSLEYFDIGAPVVIEPPAADQVTDETAAVKRLFGGTTGG
jgi:hypothetical protein